MQKNNDNPQNEIKRALLVAGVWCLFCLMTSCSPYVIQGVTSTGTPVLPSPSITATATRTPTPRPSCIVTTGYQRGAVNVRAGGEVQAAVIQIVHEGETLTVITRAAWLEVITSQGKRGFINSRYCQIGE